MLELVTGENSERERKEKLSLHHSCSGSALHGVSQVLVKLGGGIQQKTINCGFNTLVSLKSCELSGTQEMTEQRPWGFGLATGQGGQDGDSGSLCLQTDLHPPGNGVS